MEEILPVLLKERLSVGCSELNVTDPYLVFEKFEQFIFNQTESLGIHQFEKIYFDMASERSAN